MPSLRRFFDADLRSLAAFRVALGAVLLWDLADRASALTGHYTDAGILPRAIARASYAGSAWSLHMLAGSTPFEACLFAITAAAYVAYAIGWHARLSGLVSLLLLVSMQERNPLVAEKSDDLLRQLLFWTLFTPVGERFAIGLPRDQARAPGRARGFGVVGLLLQPVWLYASVFVSKLEYGAWTEGRAVRIMLHKAAYATFLGARIEEMPALCTALTYATLVVEGSIPLLLLSPWRRGATRTTAVLLGAVFQGSLAACATIGHFQPLAAAALLPWLPAITWEAAPIEGPVSRPNRWLDAVALVLALEIAISNALAFPRTAILLPRPMAAFEQALGLQQHWRMFANIDRTTQGWWVFLATLEDGRRIDVLTGAPDPGTTRPELFSAALPFRWMRFWASMRTDDIRTLILPRAADWLCDEWNHVHGGPDRAAAIAIVRVDETWAPASGGTVTPVEMLSGYCPR